MANNTLRHDSVGIYLREIGRYPLLTAEEELNLARQIQPMVKLQELKASLEKATGIKVQDSQWARESDLSELQLKKTLAVGIRAKQQMIQANLRLVVSIAKHQQVSAKSRGVALEFMDLIQEGTLGLNRAAEKFDPNKGYRFTTYAYRWIQQFIMRAIAEKARTVRLPVHVIEKQNRSSKWIARFRANYGRYPTNQEFNEFLKSIKWSREAHDAIYQTKTASLDKMVLNEGTPLGDFVGTEDAQMNRTEWASFSQSLLESASLTPQERRVIMARHGLDDGQEKTLAAIGEIMSISRERVRQLEMQAIKKLRKVALCAN